MYIPIKRMLDKDYEFLKSVARIGFVTENLLPYFDLNKARLDQHISSGNIVKKGVYLIYGSLTSVYVLSDNAKKFVSSEYAISPYKSDMTQLEHDYVLGKIYGKLTSNLRNSWLTEGQIKDKYPLSDTTTDGMYINESGKRIAVEVITDNYSKKTIEQKIDFIRYYCDDGIVIHTHRNVQYSL